MGEKLVIGPFNRGLRNDRPPFMIDNDSFPTLINAYQWRGRVKRKRGTSLLGRLKRQVTVNQFTDPIGVAILNPVPIAPGSINILAVASGEIYTDPNKNGILVGSLGDPGTINYKTGRISLPAEGLTQITGTFDYYPLLPVMGLREFAYNTTQYPGTIAFDTVYSYNINVTAPYDIYDVSFFKNPPVSLALPGYVRKAAPTALTWNGTNYQQFWTTNYQGAMWATNGVRVPFVENISHIGMQFDPITGAAYAGQPAPLGPPAIVTFSVAASPAIIGDFVFINEILGMTGVNFQTGYVVAVGAGTVTVEFPNSIVAGAYGGGGIMQYLTTRKDATLDCIRWYDGDPTLLQGEKGWVNFCPPLINPNSPPVSIGDLPTNNPDGTIIQYYLVGAKMVLQFKDRLLAIGAVVQASNGLPKYVQDTVIFSQNGTPYYTCSFVEPASGFAVANIVFQPILLPDNQSATCNSWFVNSTGFGGTATAGLDESINTCSSNEDILVMGFTTNQTRFVYTGNDILPFQFYLVNSELGSGSTFSAINMDAGVITRGTRGYILTSQTNAQRIDLEIPDAVFEIQLISNGSERVTAIRDYINEWIYFTYPNNTSGYVYPTSTLQYNYRDNSWGLFNESYTTYGIFKRLTGFTWLTVPWTWDTWNQAWNAGNYNTLQPQIIAGNQQGFVIVREANNTFEGASLQIADIVGNLITSPDHCLSIGDFIYITGATGTVAAQVNGKIFMVATTPDKDTFTINAAIAAATYNGAGLITRIYRPFIATKQFPVSWSSARKTRLGPQQYLLSKTEKAQTTLLIYLSEDEIVAYNNPSQVLNSGLTFSAVLYTCPESSNLGLTPANTNLAMLNTFTADGTISNNQSQIWHRVNTSLLGDTIQVALTLSDAQMSTLDDDGNFISQFAEIELMGIIMDVSPSGWLA